MLLLLCERDSQLSNDMTSLNDGIKEKVPYVPGHALHEKGLQRQKGVGLLVSSQEQRALFVPR